MARAGRFTGGDLAGKRGVIKRLNGGEAGARVLGHRRDAEKGNMTARQSGLRNLFLVSREDTQAKKAGKQRGRRPTCHNFNSEERMSQYEAIR